MGSKEPRGATIFESIRMLEILKNTFWLCMENALSIYKNNKTGVTENNLKFFLYMYICLQTYTMCFM